jgi:hypothetical protein
MTSEPTHVKTSGDSGACKGLVLGILRPGGHQAWHLMNRKRRDGNAIGMSTSFSASSISRRPKADNDLVVLLAAARCLM